MGISLKSSAEIEIMRKACHIQSKILNEVGAAVCAGISTGKLDDFAEQLCREHNVKPAFKGYGGFPATICASVNDKVVHGIPSHKEVLQSGDIIAIDFGVILDGFYADACQTFCVGEVSDSAQKLIERTRESLYRGIEQARVGNRLGDIGFAIQSFTESFGYAPVRETVGHGIGRKLHEFPEVPNWGTAGQGIKLVANMTICIEPIINAGTPEIITEADGWTTRTADGELSAHFEHQILIREEGTEILTNWDKNSHNHA